MTVATTRTRRFRIDQIVTAAYRLAGLLNEHQAPNTAQKNAAYDLLETMLKENQVTGLFAREIVFETITLTAGTNEYNLSESTFDVIADGMYIDAAESDPDHAAAEMVVTQIDREQRQTIQAKNASAIPTMFYVDRTADTVKVWLWPIPNEAGRVRFQVHRFVADSFDGNATPDLEVFWEQWEIWELAHQLATAASLSMDRILHLQTVAEKKLMLCRAYANPRGSQQAYADHPTPWSN